MDKKQELTASITAEKAEIAVAGQQEAATQTAPITALNGDLTALQGQPATLNSQLTAEQQDSSTLQQQPPGLRTSLAEKWTLRSPWPPRRWAAPKPCGRPRPPP